jgi:hypothetical protein
VSIEPRPRHSASVSRRAKAALPTATLTERALATHTLAIALLIHGLLSDDADSRDLAAAMRYAAHVTALPISELRELGRLVGQEARRPRPG